MYWSRWSTVNRSNCVYTRTAAIFLSKFWSVCTRLFAGVTMTVVITAPKCKTVKLTFNEFEMFRRLGLGCFRDGLEIRAGEDLLTSGTWWVMCVYWGTWWEVCMCGCGETCGDKYVLTLAMSIRIANTINCFITIYLHNFIYIYIYIYIYTPHAHTFTHCTLC